MSKKISGSSIIEAIELNDQDKADIAACKADIATEEQVRTYILKMIELRKRHYAKKCEINAKTKAVVQDTIQEQGFNKNMQDLVGELWAEIIIRATKASTAGKVPANYMLNAILHASTEASIMAIESYAQAYKSATGENANTAELLQSYATSMGKSILEAGRIKGLI